MSTPDFEVHRAIVHYSDPVSGDAQVRIPSLLGIDQVVSIPTIGLTNTDGFWNVPSVGASVFVAVSDDRTQFLWLTAVGISGSGGDDPSNEPIGHEDRTASYIAFDNGTRTFSIQPANGSYVVWCVGLRYEKANLESIQIPDTTGLYYISFNAQGQLQYSTDYFVWDQDCPTAYVYWNSTTQRAEFFADERHGITMDWQTHEYLHRTRGAAYANGFDASNFDTSTQNGNTDAQAKLDIDNGTFFDEDLQVDVRHSLAPAQNTWEQQLQGPARIPVFYRSGTSYVYDAPTDFPVKQGTSHPLYNSSSGGNWSTTELGANSYGIQWIVGTNQLNYPILSIMGQAQYSNVGQAEAASWADMDLDGLPIVEIRVLYKIVFRATGSNTPGCYFDQIDDYRNALSNATSTAAAVVDHGNLTGLGDDDHPQYLTSGRADLLYADINASPTITLAGDATGSVTLTDLGSGTLTLAVVNDSHTHDGRYYTETESDSRFVNVTGDTITGNLSVNGTLITDYIRNDNGNFLALEGGDSWNLGSNASGEYVWMAAESGIVIVSSDANSTVWADRNQVRISPSGGIDENLIVFAKELRVNNIGGANAKIGRWQANDDYAMFGTDDMTGAEYSVLAGGATDGNTYISAQSGASVFIRPSANSTTNQASFSTSGAFFGTTTVSDRLWIGSGGINLRELSGELDVNAPIQYDQYLGTELNGGTNNDFISNSDSAYGGYGGRWNFHFDNSLTTGNGNAAVTAGRYYASNTSVGSTSDARLKKNIADFDNEIGLHILRQLRPRTFEWDYDDPTGLWAHGTQIGLVAQEVDEVFPAWVDYWPQEDARRKSDGEIVERALALGLDQQFQVMVVSAIQNLADRIEALETA